MEGRFYATFLGPAMEFIGGLSGEDQLKFTNAVAAMKQGDFLAVRTKVLKGSIRELIIKNYRLIYFLKPPTLYFLRGFVKKTNKTPSKRK